MPPIGRGGRFFEEISTYRLIDVGTVPGDLLNAGKWLTLAGIRSLLGEGGWFTNEARSTLSLILPWL
jgi:oxidase EvaA